MITENQVELIMECKVRTKTLISEGYSTWNPFATSTPIRKPLHTLSNFMTFKEAKECDLARGGGSPGVTLSSDLHESSKLQVVHRENILKRKREKDNSSSDEEDDIDGCKKGKQLVIKIGSNHETGGRAMKKRLFNVLQTPVKLKIGNKSKGRLYKTKEMSTLSFHKSNIDIENKEYINKSTKTLQLETNKNLKLESDNQTVDESLKNVKKLSKVLQVSCVIQNQQSPETNECNKPNEIAVEGDVKSSKLLLQKRNFPLHRKSSANKLNKTLLTSKKSKINKNKTQKSKVSKEYEKDLNIHDAVEKNIQSGSSGASSSHRTSFDETDEKLRNSRHSTRNGTEVISLNDVEVDHSVTDDCTKQTLKKLEGSENKKSNLISVLDSKNKAGDCAERITRPKRTRKSPKEIYLPNSGKRKDALSKEYAVNHVEDNKLQNKATILMNESCKKEFGNKSVSVHKNTSVTCPSNDFIKNIAEMEFGKNAAENGEEYSTSVAWEFSLFKCCILKINKKSEASGRTKSRKSHFGGIVFKGRISMTIQGTETSMTQGQMFYVPPLTDWRAVNRGRTDCIIYYWCGRF